MFEHVLVPVDLSPQAERALKAVQEVAAPGASIELLHIVERIPGLDDDETREFYDQLEVRARRQLDTWAATLEALGFRVEVTLRIGKRAAEIVDRIRETSCALVLLASHALDPSEPTRAVGTVSHQIALVAPCSVLLIR